MEKKGEVSSRNIYKVHMDKAKGGRFEDGRQGWLWLGRVVSRKCRQLYLNSNKKLFKK